MTIKTYFETLIDEQYRQPQGVMGHIIGRRMARQHIAENMWTVSLMNVQTADHLLEIGFGSGIAIQQLTRLVTRGFIAGIDISHTMVNAARRRNAPAIKAGRVDLNYGNVANLPFKDNAFDKVFSIHTLYFWPDPMRGLQEIHRVLKTGGLLTLTILPKEQWPGSDTASCAVYSGEDIVKMLTLVGFSQISIEKARDQELREIAVIGVK